MIWGLITAIMTFTTAIVFSMGKISGRGERITAAHRVELLSRKEMVEENSVEEREKRDTE